MSQAVEIEPSQPYEEIVENVSLRYVYTRGKPKLQSWRKRSLQSISEGPRQQILFAPSSRGLPWEWDRLR